MPADGLRWLLALAVIAHGIGHVLFMPALSGALRLDATGRSWLLTPLVGEGPVQVIATTVGGAALLAFVLGAGAFLLRAPWWRPVVLGAAVASAALVLAMWDGLQRSSAVAAVAFDAAIVVAVAVAHWPADPVAAP